jgi:16S rRNA (adenine(1408)-N(1))-methyltransferase
LGADLLAPGDGAPTAILFLSFHRSQPNRQKRMAKMELMIGKESQTLTAPDLLRRASAYSEFWIDLGTGDGRFVLETARGQAWINEQSEPLEDRKMEKGSRLPAAKSTAMSLPDQPPGRFVLGVDACRENLHRAARRAPENALFVIANACRLPEELAGLAHQVTINFPWGSLRDGLLTGDSNLINGICRVARPGAVLEVRLNESALAEAGWSLEEGGKQVNACLLAAGVAMQAVQWMDAAALRACPSTWARKMAFGRKPAAVLLRGFFQP